MILAHDFRHFLDTFFTARSKDRQSREARHEFKENIKNMQISQKSPEVERKQKRRHQTSIENLQAAECNQLQQTPSSKIGGGGARAARRIRIRCGVLWDTPLHKVLVQPLAPSSL